MNTVIAILVAILALLLIPSLFFKMGIEKQREQEKSDELFRQFQSGEVIEFPYRKRQLLGQTLIFSIFVLPICALPAFFRNPSLGLSFFLLFGVLGLFLMWRCARPLMSQGPAVILSRERLRYGKIDISWDEISRLRIFSGRGSGALIFDIKGAPKNYIFFKLPRVFSIPLQPIFYEGALAKCIYERLAETACRLD